MLFRFYAAESTLTHQEDGAPGFTASGHKVRAEAMGTENTHARLAGRYGAWNRPARCVQGTVLHACVCVARGGGRPGPLLAASFAAVRAPHASDLSAA
jgi:hypothetical protein